jgi:hypothetical protein
MLSFSGKILFLDDALVFENDLFPYFRGEVVIVVRSVAD